MNSYSQRDPQLRMGCGGRFNPLLLASLSPQELNAYTYVQNNPVNFTDPMGWRRIGRVSVRKIFNHVTGSYEPTDAVGSLYSYADLIALPGYYSTEELVAEGIASSYSDILRQPGFYGSIEEVPPLGYGYLEVGRPGGGVYQRFPVYGISATGVVKKGVRARVEERRIEEWQPLIDLVTSLLGGKYIDLARYGIDCTRWIRENQNELIRKCKEYKKHPTKETCYDCAFKLVDFTSHCANPINATMTAWKFLGRCEWEMKE